MNCTHFSHQKLWQLLGHKICPFLRSKIISSSLSPRSIHTVFSPKSIIQPPTVKVLSKHSLHFLNRSNNIEDRLTVFNRSCVGGFSQRSYAASRPDYNHYTDMEQKAILHQFNRAPHEILCNYGLRSSVALAVEEGRPFHRLVELLKVPGIGFGVLTKTCQRVHAVLQQKKAPVQPPVTLQWAQEFKDVVSVSVLPGFIAYAHLTLVPGYVAETADILDNGDTSDTSFVQVTALNLLPVETKDPKLHPHKLLQKVVSAMQNVPLCSVYALPVSGVLGSAASTLKQANIALQRSQVMGAVQGLLAQRCALNKSEIFYVRDTVVHDVFFLRVGKEITANLELLTKLMHGSSTSLPNWDIITVPRLRVSPTVQSHFASLGSSRQRTVAPALYSGLVFCSAVGMARRTHDQSSVH